MQLLQSWADGTFPTISQALLRETVMLTVVQCLIRTLNVQNLDGFWGHTGPREETCYSILALKKLASLPLAVFCYQQIFHAIDRGQAFLNSQSSISDPEYLWVEKVRYGSLNLSRAYTISAKWAPLPPQKTKSALVELCDIDSAELVKFADFFQQLPLLRSQPRWLILASWIEARLFLPRLKALRETIFIRAGMTKDKYLEGIPIIWTSANNANGSRLSSRYLFDMMTLSLLNYQADKYMESVVGGQCSTHIPDIRRLIRIQFTSPRESEDGELEHSHSD